MNISSTSSSYVNNASSNKGFSGLASGMDTESMVEAMLSGTQAKIDKQKGIKQQTIWKQDMYRNIITKINSFQNKYFGASSPTNFMSKNFWNTMKVNSSSSAFSVKAGSSATVGKTSVSVSQLAKAAKVTSKNPMDTTLKGELKLDEIKKQVAEAPKDVTLIVDSKEVTIDFKELFTDSNGNSISPAPEAVAQKLNDAFQGISGLEGLEAKVVDGNIEITSKVEMDIHVSDKSSAAGLQILGLSASSTSESYRIPAPPKPDGSPDPDAQPTKGSKLTGNKSMDMGNYFSLEVTVDGVPKNVQVDVTNITDGKGFEAAMNKSLQHAFGDAVTVSYDDASKNLTFNVRPDSGSTVMVTGNNTELLGLVNGQSNRIGLGAPLDMYFKDALDSNGEASFTINGKTIKVNKDMTVGDLIRKVNSSGAGVTMAYQSASNTFTLTQNDTGEGFSIDVKDNQGSLMSKLFGGDNTSGIGNLEKGANAEAVINGQKVIRNSNSFEFDGLTFTLNSTTTNTESVDVTRDTDTIVEGVKSFVKDYNAMLEEFNGLLSEDTEYRKYAPLTDAQKKEMTEKEITLWEEKAKKGLLRNDATLSNFLQSMRSVMYQKVPGTDYALYDLGIQTGTWEQKGQLVFDEDGEATLRRLLESNADQVANLFTDEQNGLATKLNDIMNRAASTSYISGGVNGKSSFGAFVELAGEKGKYSETQSSMHKQLESIDAKIKDLKSKYEQEKNRHWKKFNAMEKMIAQLSSQSSWLAQQFG